MAEHHSRHPAQVFLVFLLFPPSVQATGCQPEQNPGHILLHFPVPLLLQPESLPHLTAHYIPGQIIHAKLFRNLQTVHSSHSTMLLHSGNTVNGFPNQLLLLTASSYMA